MTEEAILSVVEETQKRIIRGTLMLFEMQQAIEKLPESEAKIELVAKHDAILLKISALQSQISEADAHACWYGFTNQCPGCACADCQPMIHAFEIPHIQTSEEFDAERVVNARKYYQEKEDAEAF